MRKLIFLLFLFLGLKMSQACDVITYHATCNNPFGRFEVQNCTSDSLRWSNGDTSRIINVPPGTYFFTEYSGGIQIGITTITMGFVNWEILLNYDPFNNLISITTHLDYWYTPGNSHLICEPPAPDYAFEGYFLEDNIIVDTLPMGYWYTSFFETNFSPGHIYDFVVNDTNCGCNVSSATLGHSLVLLATSVSEELIPEMNVSMLEDRLQVSLNAGSLYSGELFIFSSDGKLITHLDKLQLEMNIDLSRLATGVYIVKVVNSKGIQQKKIIKV